jgi:hypothetical protein
MRLIQGRVRGAAANDTPSALAGPDHRRQGTVPRRVAADAVVVRVGDQDVA